MDSDSPSVAPRTPSPALFGLEAACLLLGAPLVLVGLLVGLLALTGADFVADATPQAETATMERVPPPPPPQPASPPELEILPVIGPNTPREKLLPRVPEVSKSSVYLGDNLESVPEVMLEASQQATVLEWRRRRIRAVASALHLNRAEEDGYLKELLKQRPDLAGLPFLLGGACRTTEKVAAAFKKTVEAVRGERHTALLLEKAGKEHKRELYYRPYLAAVSQMIPAEGRVKQQEMILGVASVPRPEATHALARLAVFSPDKEVRAAAIEALTIRREEDATAVLVAGLNYPWPAVAANAATAIAKLQRTDLIPLLEKMRAAPDPREPRLEKKENTIELVAHELVRVNHHRNCLLCHAAAERKETPEEILTAAIPVPTLPLPNTSRGYGFSASDLLVRVDVTYLRQDFSTMQEVKDWTAGAWPVLQRFDFLVRRRVLSPAEAGELRQRLAGESPYHRAAANALRLLSERAEEKRHGRS